MPCAMRSTLGAGRELPSAHSDIGSMRRPTKRYVSVRLLGMVPVLIGTSIITFALTHLLGNPVYAMLGPFATPEAVAETTRQLGLDKPVWEQYAAYLGGVLHGDFGTSLYTGRPVLDDLTQRFPITLQLITLALAGALVVGIVLGLWAAWHPGS